MRRRRLLFREQAAERLPRQHTSETEQQAQQYVEAAGQVPALFKQLHSLQGEGGKGAEGDLSLSGPGTVRSGGAAAP